MDTGIGRGECANRNRDNKKTARYAVFYIVENFKGHTQESREGELAWFTKNEILKLKLWEGDYKFLPYLFKNKFFSGKFTYKDGKLIDYSLIFNL